MIGLGLIKGLFTSARFWVIAGGLAAATTFAIWGYNQIYSAGYRAAQVKYQEQQLRAVQKAVKEARSRWEAASLRAEEELKRETEIVTKARGLERRVPTVVERSVSVECRDLGPDIQRLFNNAIRPSSDREGGNAAPTSDATGRMP